jgi:hypothetical protein
MIGNDELERMRKEAGEDYFKVLYQRSSAGTEKSKEIVSQRNCFLK